MANAKDALLAALMTEIEDPKGTQRSVGALYGLAIASINCTDEETFGTINRAIMDRWPGLPALERVKKVGWSLVEATGARLRKAAA